LFITSEIFCKNNAYCCPTPVAKVSFNFRKNRIFFFTYY